MSKNTYNTCQNTSCSKPLIKYQKKYCSIPCQGKQQILDGTSNVGKKKPLTNKCINCNELTKNPKFCSHTCSAIIGNAKRKIIKHCVLCETITSNPRYCSHKCSAEHRQHRHFKLQEQTNSYNKTYILNHYGNQCQKCGITEYNNELIVMELEHIDGDSDNNNFDNLTLLCPNCHSQTPTYKNRNKGNGRHFRRLRYANGQSY
jgi:hypothetical protein